MYLGPHNFNFDDACNKVQYCSGYEIHEYPRDIMYSNPRVLNYENAPINLGIKLVYPELSHW